MLIKVSERKKSSCFRKFIFILFVFNFCITLCSCSTNEVSSDSNSDNSISTSENSSPNSSYTESAIETSEESSSEYSSEEYIYNSLKDIIKENIDDNNIKYTTSGSILFDSKETKICSVYNSNPDLVYYTTLLSSENTDSVSDENTETNANNINNYSACYKDGFCFFDDEFLGKSSYEISIDDFKLQFENYFHFYELLSYSENLSKENENIYIYDLTDDILTSPLITTLCSGISYDSFSIKDGQFKINLIDNVFESANGYINLCFIIQNQSIEATINLSVDICESETDFDYLNNNFIQYNTKDNFYISRSLYNLISNESFEFSSESRFYYDYKNNNYVDTTSYLAVNCSDAASNLYYEFNCLSEPSIKYEEFIFDSIVYENISFENDVFSDFSPVSDTAKSIVSVAKSSWGILPFDITLLESFNIIEDDIFYIIEYVYAPDTAIDIITNYTQAYNLSFSEFSPIPTVDQYNYVSSVGKIIIRKSDFIIVEQECDIVLQSNNSVESRLIISSEVLSIDQNISIPKP